MSRLALLLAVLSWGAVAHAQTAPVPVGHDEAGTPVSCIADPPDALAARRAPSVGEVQMLIVRVRFAGDAEPPPHPDPETVRAWYARESYGALDLQITEAPVVDLPETRAHYDELGDSHSQGVWVDEVEARLAAAGTPHADFGTVAMIAQPGAPFDLDGAVGRAELLGSRLWTTTASEFVLIHEIGHTLGLNHARRRQVRNGNPFEGTVLSYGNPYDAMGNVAAGAFGAASKAWLGWMDTLPNVLDLLEVEDDDYMIATVRLRATDVPASPGAAGGLRIDLPEATCVPSLRAELRADLEGVLLQEWEPFFGTLFRSTLLDATPGLSPSDGDYRLPFDGSPLLLHRFIHCPETPDVNLRVTATGTDADGLWADLQVAISTPSGGGGDDDDEEIENRRPYVSLSEFAEGTDYVMGEPVTLDVIAWDPDGDAVQVSVQVGDDWIEVPAPPSVRTWTPPTPGAYSIRARATDSDGAWSISRRRAILVEDRAVAAADTVAELVSQQVYANEWARLALESFVQPVAVVMVRDPQDFRDVPELRGRGADLEVRVPRRTAESQRQIVVLTAEAGTYQLRDGSRLYAGTVQPAPGRWVPVPFEEPGDRTPGVFVSAIGSAGDDAPPRIRRVQPDGFEVWSDAGHPVDFIAVEPALLPSDAAANRLETGVMDITVGGMAVTMRQWFDDNPAVYVAAVQDADADDEEPPAVQASAAAQRLLISLGDAEPHLVERSVAYLVSGRPAGRSSATPILGTTLSAVSDPPTTVLEFRATVAPNPTRGAADLLLTLLEEETVRATLFDVLGREVAQIADGPFDIGKTAVPMPRGLPAGVYLVHVRIGDAVRTGRFTVVR